MVKRLYCGNLRFNVGSSELEQLFSQFGNVVSATVIEDHETGRSRGFGFVEMEDDGEALQAVDALNDTEHEGRTLRVNEAKPREQRSSRRG